jgi:hypothetical protein
MCRFSIQSPDGKQSVKGCLRAVRVGALRRRIASTTNVGVAVRGAGRFLGPQRRDTGGIRDSPPW